MFITPGTICFFSNGIFKPINKTPFEDVLKNFKFRLHLAALKSGKQVKYNGHWFQMQK